MWLLGTEAGAIIWASLLAAIGVCIRYDDRTEARALDRAVDESLPLMWRQVHATLWRRQP